MGKKVPFGPHESGVQFFWSDDNSFFVTRAQSHHFGTILSKVLNGMLYFGITLMFIHEIYKNVLQSWHDILSVTIGELAHVVKVKANIKTP